MRHKQRPVKSSRHKSVTFIINSQTSFGDGSSNSGGAGSSGYNDSQYNHSNVKPTFSSSSKNFQMPTSNIHIQQHSQQNRHQHPPVKSESILQRPQRSRATTSSSSTSLLIHQQPSGSGQPSASSSINLSNPTQSTRSIIATNDDNRHNHDNPLMRKQFEHNFSHMDAVMRLAFFENNDISLDDCSKVDFNSLSTASILQRNIQQQLQQERREQIQLRQQQQQLHQQRQQQRQQHNQQHQSQQSKNLRQQQSQEKYRLGMQIYEERQQQLQPFYETDEIEKDLPVEEYNPFEDDEITDSRIFATTTPNTSLQNHYNQHQRTSNINESTRPKQAHQANRVGAARSQVSVSNAVTDLNADYNQPTTSSSSPRKRTRDSQTRVEFSNHVQVETIQNYGEGFLCDEPGCGKSFPSLRKLRHHKVVHSDEFPFICEFKGCAKKFKRKFGIDLHSTTHFDLDPGMYSKTSNNSSLPFFGRRMQYSMCKPCGQKFKTVHEYQYHMLKHGKEPFKCPVRGCGQTFGIWKSFQKHRASHYFNYYCKMDPRCDHHTSNLQLLKLHIYCCHFRRKLPENATLSSKDQPDEHEKLAREDDVFREMPIDVVDTEDQPQIQDQRDEEGEEEEDEEEEEEEQGEGSLQMVVDSPPREPTPPPPRRDSRLRKNPPRSSTFGHQDYASINNGSIFAKSLPSTPQSKRTRAAVKQEQSQSSEQDQSVNNYSTERDESYEAPDSVSHANTTPASSTNRSLVSSSQSKDSQRSSSSNGKKRMRDSASQRSFLPSPVKEEIIQSFGEGFLCDEPGCGKSFPSLRKLRHHKVVHSDEFPFICEFKGCAKKFKRKFGIDLHSTTHFDLDPGMYSKTSNNSSLPFFGRRMQYSMCKPCGQKFKTVHEYQYHMLKHGKEPFKCPVRGCGQTFGIWKSFQKHRASHYFNYYCKMDPRCDHHTSNLQLLKLHIYCCHFRRKLPENATLSSKDRPDEHEKLAREDDVFREMPIDVVDDEQSILQSSQEEQSFSAVDEPQEEKPSVSTPRRDSRLRKNPPRSSTFGHQDYASINNGSSFAKSIPSTPQTKRTRSTASSSGSSQQLIGSQSASQSEKKVKLPLKVLPKRSAQRLPMSLIADDRSSEDEGHSSECESYRNDRDGEGSEHDSTKRNIFRCHLCDYKFAVRFQLTKHLSTHLELTPEMYSKTADKQVVQLSERRRREFYCEKCRVKFEQMTNLDEHMQKKHGQRPYVCHFCQVPSTFSLAKQYLSHLYEHRFIYKCTMAPDCDFTINRKDALKLHIFRMHLNQQLPSYLEDFANCVDWDEANGQ